MDLETIVDAIRHIGFCTNNFLYFNIFLSFIYSAFQGTYRKIFPASLRIISI